MEHEHESEKLRALWHALFGILAVLFGQIIAGDDETKIRLVREVGGLIVVADVLLRLLLYHIFIKPEDVSHWWKFFRGVRVVCIFLEKWLLIKTKILRPKEREFPAAATPFVLGILIPLEFGAPLYTVMVSLIVLGFGDPAAREVAIWLYKKFRIRNKIRENGKKTWQGFWGFIAFASVGVTISVILDWPFPAYPHCQTGQLVLALVLGIFAGAFAELIQEVVEARTEKVVPWLRRTLCLLFDDNFTIPITTATVVALVMAI